MFMMHMMCVCGCVIFNAECMNFLISSAFSIFLYNKDCCEAVSRNLHVRALCDVIVVDAFDERKMREILHSMKDGRIITLSEYDFLTHSP